MTRDHAQRSLGLAVLSLAALGCVPWPHHEAQMARISGVVKVAGEPAAGAEIRLTRSSADPACAKPERVTRADAEGRFGFAAERKFRFFKSVLGDRYYQWTLCILAGGKSFLGHRYGRVGYTDESVELRCTIGPESRESAVCTVPPAALLPP